LNGLKGRVWFLGAVLLLEGIALVIFSRIPTLGVAVIAMMIFSLFVQMSEGATYGIVPFINKKAVGPVAGIVGAGGNAGAVAAGFLFRLESLATQDALLILGLLVVATSSLSLLVRFTPEVEAEEKAAFAKAVEHREALAAI
jgi:NNP family nitrate/nitrite transporter-like MFS transporter